MIPTVPATTSIPAKAMEMIFFFSIPPVATDSGFGNAPPTNGGGKSPRGNGEIPGRGIGIGISGRGWVTFGVGTTGSKSG